MDPATSLFNGGNSLNFDLPNGTGLDNGKEEDEEAEEIRIKEKELQDLLTTEFDDLIDDDDNSTVGESIQEEDQIDNQLNGYKIQPKWPFIKENETSTPKHPIPPWNTEYTPINEYEPSPHERPNGINVDARNEQPHQQDLILQHANHGSSSPLLYQMNGHQRIPLTHELQHKSISVESSPTDYAAMNGHTQEPLNFQYKQDGFSTFPEGFHHQYAHELVNMKEKMVQLQEESSQNIRLLKHQLTLSKGENEGLAFSLKQARQVLIDKEKDLHDAQTLNDELKQQLQEQKFDALELQEKLEVSQSLAESYKSQLAEMTKFETYSHMKDEKDALIRNMELKHQDEINELNRNLNSKEKTMDRLSKQVEKLEKYQEQTMPHKLQGIDQLTRNLRTVESYCQQIIHSGTYQTVGQMRQASETDKTPQNVQLLLNAINEVGAKLPLANGATISIEAYRTAILELEKEKNDIEKELQITKKECNASMAETGQLREDNRKLRGTMETMIKKHDLDIKSAIEKYHSLHSKETKLLQEELGEAAEEEKTRLREFYEEKLATLYMETENLKSSLNEIKNLYIKVCEEKTILESEVLNWKSNQNQETTSQCLTSKESEQNIETMINLRVESELLRRQSELERAWANNKEREINEALEECRKDHYRKETQLKQKIAEINEELVQTEEELQKQKEFSTKDAEAAKLIEKDKLETKRQDEIRERLQHRISELERELLESRRILEHKQNELQMLNDRFNQEWTSRQLELQDVYKRKLEEIGRAQQEELDKIMLDVEKAVAKEQTEFLNRQNMETQNVHVKIKQLQSEVSFLKRPKDKRDASVSISLPSVKQEHVINQMEESLRILRSKEKQRTKYTKSATSQTEEKYIPKRMVMELNALYQDLLKQLKEEVEVFMTSTNTIAAEHLRQAVEQYYKELSRK